MAILHHSVNYTMLLLLNFGLYFAANIYHEAVNPSSLKKRRLMERGGHHQEHKCEEH